MRPIKLLLSFSVFFLVQSAFPCLSIADGPGVLVTSYTEMKLFTNNGDGYLTASSAGSIPLGGSYPNGVATVDQNGDGKQDLSIAVTGPSSHLRTYFNNSKGPDTFFPDPATMIDMDTGSWRHVHIVTDLNGDGKLDLVIENPENIDSSNTIGVMLNNGDGTFAPSTSYTTGEQGIYIHSIAAGDINGDGKPDLITSNGKAQSISIFYNNGNGTFSPKNDYSIGSFPRLAAIGDLNGDGKPDLAVPYSGNTQGAISILYNKGNGSFLPKVDYATGKAPAAVVIKDFNGDGKPDLASNNQESNTISILFNNGSGTFSPKTDYSVGINPASMVAGDLNGDGSADLVVGNNTSHTISVLLNKGNGTFSSKVDYDVPEYTQAVNLVNFDSTCGNATIESGEDCDDGANNGKMDCAYGQKSCSACSKQCTKVSGKTSFCGDGIIDSRNHETCEPGLIDNLAPGQKPTTTCSNRCEKVPVKSSPIQIPPLNANKPTKPGAVSIPDPAPLSGFGK